MTTYVRHDDEGMGIKIEEVYWKMYENKWKWDFESFKILKSLILLSFQTNITRD